MPSAEADSVVVILHSRHCRAGLSYPAPSGLLDRMSVAIRTIPKSLGRVPQPLFLIAQQESGVPRHFDFALSRLFAAFAEGANHVTPVAI